MSGKKRLKNLSDIVSGSSMDHREICLFKLNTDLKAFCWHKLRFFLGHYSSLLCVCLMWDRRTGITFSELSMPQSVCSLCSPVSSSTEQSSVPREVPTLPFDSKQSSSLSLNSAVSIYWRIFLRFFLWLFCCFLEFFLGSDVYVLVFFEPHSDHALWKKKSTTWVCEQTSFLTPEALKTITRRRKRQSVSI